MRFNNDNTDPSSSAMIAEFDAWRRNKKLVIAVELKALSEIENYRQSDYFLRRFEYVIHDLPDHSLRRVMPNYRKYDVVDFYKIMLRLLK